MKKRMAMMAVLVALAAPLAMARPHEGGGIFGHLREMREELGLSDEQVAQLRVIAAELRGQNAQYREQMRDTRKDVAATLIANPSNVAAAQALLDRQSTAERALKTNMLNATAKALAVLNAEQRAELGEKLEEMAEHRAERRRH